MAKIEKYWEWKFNIDKFLRDYPENKRVLEDKKAALAEIADLKTPNYDSPPGTPGRGDRVIASAQKAETIRAQIEECQEMIDLYEKAYNQLTDEEKIIIHYFFHAPGMTSSNVRYLSHKLNYERSRLYQKRRIAMEKMEKYIISD